MNPSPVTEESYERRSRAPGVIVDLLLAAGLAVAAIGELDLYPPAIFEGMRPLAYVASLGIVALILLRRLAPLPIVLVQCAIALWIRSGELPFPFGAETAIIISIYMIGARRSAREAVVGVVAATVARLPRLFQPATVLTSAGQAIALTVTVGWAAWIGITARRTEELNAELVATIAEIERNRLEEVAEARRQERARIARDMHDVVAHGLSIITVQAGAARTVVDTDAAAARRSLETIEVSGRQALEEMAEIVGLLSDGDPPPAIVPKRLDDLASVVQPSGAEPAAWIRVEGTPRSVGEALELSAYRIVQEGLTNVRKHAKGARALVTVRYLDDALEVEVLDEGASEPAIDVAGPGHGLIGIRERVSVFGGHVQAGPRPGGGFGLLARLPTVSEPARA